MAHYMRENFIKKCQEISKASKVPLPTDFFRYVPHKCWKCGKEILVFAFPERKVAEGKSPKLVINNIANKLLRLMCGVIKSGKPFLKGYQPINPNVFDKKL